MVSVQNVRKKCKVLVRKVGQWPFDTGLMSYWLVLLTAEPLIFALFAVWYQKKFGKI